MVLLYWLAAISAALLISGSAGAAQQAEDCRAIADPARRLACYARGVPNPTPAARRLQADLAGTRPKRRRSPGFRPNRPEPHLQQPDCRRVAAAERTLPIRLADGSEWTTSITGQRPKIGEKIHHRRTLIGTHYFDTETAAPSRYARRTEAR